MIILHAECCGLRLAVKSKEQLRSEGEESFLVKLLVKGVM
jgi:hypothetical protein